MVLLPDAYTTKGNSNKIAEIIKHNKGELFIAGNNVLFDPKVLDLVNQDNSLANIVVPAPWFVSEEQVEQYDYDADLASKLYSELGLSWHMAMSYDAAQMLIEAISIQLSENKKPNRDGTKNVLARPDFKTQGLTGTITLEGSDRKEQSNTIIHPECPDSNESCSWREIK